MSAGRSTDGADGNLAELLQSRAAMLENEKRQLLEQVVTLKHSLSTATHEHDIHCREMQSKYEAALMHIQDCGQIELQQANRSNICAMDNYRLYPLLDHLHNFVIIVFSCVEQVFTGVGYTATVSLQ